MLLCLVGYLHLIQLFLVCLVFFLGVSSQGPDICGWFSESVPYPGIRSFFQLLSDAILICPPHKLFACDFVLTFNCGNILKCLFLNVWSFLVVVLVTLHVTEP